MVFYGLLMFALASPPANDPLPEIHWLPPVQTYASPYNLARVLARLCPPTSADELARLRKACNASKQIHVGMTSGEWDLWVKDLGLHWFASGLCGMTYLYDYLCVSENGYDDKVSNVHLVWPR